MKFVYFHGSFGTPSENWFPELKTRLESMGQEIIAPQYPVDSWDELVKIGLLYEMKNQSLLRWTEVFDQIFRTKIKPGDKLCFIGHSLGPLFVLHMVEKYKILLDSAIFVSPFLDSLDRWEFNKANGSFYKTDFDFEKLKQLIPVSYVLYSDNDPYVAKKHSMLFGKALDSSVIMVRRAGHMNEAVNLNEFPLVLDLCMSRLDLSLYQQYLHHRSKLSAQEYIINGFDRGVIRLKPDDVVDEGIFHFRRLTEEGFCTFYTPLASFWDPNSDYMNEARIAAKRVGKFIRVFIVDQAEEINNLLLKKQIELDLAAGIQVYVCLYKTISSIVTEPDFGIWDNDYVCVVHFDKQKKVTQEAELNSRLIDIQKYQEWKKYILDHAKQIKYFSEALDFVKE